MALVKQARSQVVSGRLGVPARALSDAGFNYGDIVFVSPGNGALRLTRSQGNAVAAHQIDVDGRIRISPTTLRAIGFRGSRVRFNVNSNGRTITIA